MNTALLRQTLNQAFMDGVICTNFDCIDNYIKPLIKCSNVTQDERHIYCHLWINYRVYRLLKRERWSKHEPD